MSQLDLVLSRIDKQLPSALERLFELLRIKSISTDTAFKKDCRQAAQWLVDQLQAIGFESDLREAAGHPMVIGHHSGPENAPHILFYGHYDVQPADPLELWEQPPFDPVLKETEQGCRQISARGANDDKGQLMTFVEACRCWKEETGLLPCGVTILFEGEEESGSPSLLPFLRENAAELTCDFALACDTEMWDAETPAIVTGLRGLVTEDFIVKAADRDLHSGQYGGVVINPLHVISKMLAGLHDENGRVTLEGFYDGVKGFPEEIRQQWEAMEFNVGKFFGEIGLLSPKEETGYDTLEKIWALPTAEVNGVYGGYSGDGFKTVIPAEAGAKVSFRLVAGMDPEKIHASFIQYLQSCLPEGCSFELKGHSGAAAIQLDHSLPQLKKAATSLEEEWGKPAVIIGMGGSIPVIGEFRRMLGMDSLMVGFGLPDDRIHAPNEKYELSNFRKGTRSWARILKALECL